MTKEHLVQGLKDCGAIKFGHFVLTSGATSDYYIDIKKASTDPRVLRIIAQEMSAYAKGYDMLAGMELGAVPLVVALALETGLPYVIIRKEKREHGTGKQIEGSDVKGRNVLLVEDVTTSGGSVVKSIQILRAAGADVHTVLTVVDREAGARDQLKDQDVTFTPLLSVSEILQKKKI
jgi:orotate phosphoribosyltransferase